MKRKNWLFTILRNGEYVTVADLNTNPLIFLKIEEQLGYKTYLINAIEISDEEYEFWIKY